ncbi:MAG TPA: TIGR02300 family protein [Methyloceanibacter sp.]|jgi:uncharacterized protein (TIGR02300 family)|nr:TIGR02300 family protein [Methyloceanibacter sp.]
MSKPARGTKRVCPSCGARFYDLNRTPITCPVCQAVYQLPTAPSRRGERASAAGARKVEEPPPRPVEPVEVISMEEVEEAGAEATIAEEEEIVDLGDDAPEIPPGDDDNAFLEEEEEGEADVTGIVGGDKGEEG